MERITGYVVHASLNERESGRVKGPYKDKNIAEINCEDAGWYGGGGTVEEVTYFIDGDLLYEVFPPVEFVDAKEDFINDMTKKIKTKLTNEEWEFLKNYKVDG